MEENSNIHLLLNRYLLPRKLSQTITPNFDKHFDFTFIAAIFQYISISFMCFLLQSNQRRSKAEKKELEMNIEEEKK